MVTDYEMLSVIKAIARKHNLINEEDNVVDATAQALVDNAKLTQEQVDTAKGDLQAVKEG